jgi:hypothetical protein
MMDCWYYIISVYIVFILFIYDIKWVVGHPTGTRYPRGWRVWGNSRPETGGGCGWWVIYTLMGRVAGGAPSGFLTRCYPYLMAR